MSSGVSTESQQRLLAQLEEDKELYKISDREGCRSILTKYLFLRNIVSFKVFDFEFNFYFFTGVIQKIELHQFLETQKVLF